MVNESAFEGNGSDGGVEPARDERRRPLCDGAAPDVSQEEQLQA